MKEFNSNFNDGTGKLNIQYEGTAGTTEAPVTSDCNCGDDRTVQVTVVTDDGEVSKNVTVNQEGVREQFIPSDQTEGIRGSDGELFLGIKEKYADAVPDCCKPQDYLVYTTTSDNQIVKITNIKHYAKRIYLEDGTELDVSGIGSLNYTFPNAGEHKVWIEFKEDVTSFDNYFYGCSSLTSIPENLFETNTAVTSFSACFHGCTGLTSIPENLFKTNTAVTSFDNCFYGCSSLTSIPGNLFATNTFVTYFSYCFYGCTELRSIPENLFGTNTAVTSFTYCFFDCANLASSCPIDNDGTPIYNRSSGKDSYAVVTSYSYCFFNCTKMADYSSIPSDWK